MPQFARIKSPLILKLVLVSYLNSVCSPFLLPARAAPINPHPPTPSPQAQNTAFDFTVGEFCTQRFQRSTSPVEKKDRLERRDQVEKRGTAQGIRPTDPGCLWEVGQTIYVRFLSGNAALQARVMRVGREWTRFSGLRFQQLTNNLTSRTTNETETADIRISFDPNGGYWSFIGKCTPPGQTIATMNLGALDENSEFFHFYQVVAHEFGHAGGGLLHEQSNPKQQIHWNLPAVYAYYNQTQGWSPSTVDANVLASAEQPVTSTPYDPYSIMEYAIPASLTLDGFSVPPNFQLSETDKTFIAQLYPGLPDTSLPPISGAARVRPDPFLNFVVLVLMLYFGARMVCHAGNAHTTGN